jgi:large subunit ribosomal protein L18
MAIKSKKVKITARERSKIRIRKNMTGSLVKPRLTVFKSSKHTYAQAVDDVSGKTIAAASTLEKEVVDLSKKIAKEKAAQTEASQTNASKDSTKSVVAATAVGKVLAERLAAKKTSSLVFDRNGYVFTGRVKAVADGIREAGLNF